MANGFGVTVTVPFQMIKIANLVDVAGVGPTALLAKSRKRICRIGSARWTLFCVFVLGCGTNPAAFGSKLNSILFDQLE
jgi:hypothetical protein